MEPKISYTVGDDLITGVIATAVWSEARRPGLWQDMLRAVDRAGELYESMCLRGYQGEFYYGSAQKLRAADAVFFAAGAGVISVFRIVPVFVLVGELFVR